MPDPMSPQPSTPTVLIGIAVNSSTLGSQSTPQLHDAQSPTNSQLPNSQKSQKSQILVGSWEWGVHWALRSCGVARFGRAQSVSTGAALPWPPPLQAV